MAKKILILGGVLPALSLVRRLERIAEDVEIICHEDDVIAYSKFGLKHQYSTLDDVEILIGKWVEVNKSYSDQWLIIPCSEFFVEFIGLLIGNGFEVFSLSQDILDVFADKKLFYAWLGSLDIHVGDFFDLDTRLSFEANEKYIVKVSKLIPKYKSSFKTAVIDSSDELHKIVENIPCLHRDNFVIQRLYPNTQNISYGGVWVCGKEVASVVVQQLRQYPKGVTSAVELHKNENDIAYIKNVISRIAGEKKLNGFIELEFVKNKQGLVPIDLNARLWGWSSFLFYSYPACVGNILEGGDKPVEFVQVDSWSNLWRDLPAILKGEESLVQKINSIFLLFTSTKRIDFIFWRDVKPEILSFVKKLI